MAHVPIKALRYKHRPIVIEAFQITKELMLGEGYKKWPYWLSAAHNMPSGEPGSVYFKGDYLYCMTLEGECHISWDDFIIRGIEGELYPCKPGIFKKTYTLVEDKEKTS